MKGLQLAPTQLNVQMKSSDFYVSSLLGEFGSFPEAVIIMGVYKTADCINCGVFSFAWGGIFVQNTSSSMMMFIRINTTVVNVESAVLGCCYSKMMKDTHRCVERAIHHSCPVCFEFLFDTTKDITVTRSIWNV